MTLGKLSALRAPGSLYFQGTKAFLPVNHLGEGLQGSWLCERYRDPGNLPLGPDTLIFGVGVLWEIFASIKVEQSSPLEIKQS